jgi:uncharacterized protein YbbK (DUF523 family)
MPKKILNIGVSSCLLGNSVRYDGEHKFHPEIATQLGHLFNLIPFCPETDSGMGVPRPPIHLAYINSHIRAIDKKFFTPDYTQQLQQQASNYLLKHPDINGLLLQENSPSCGHSSVKVHDISGQLINTQGIGIFTAYIIKSKPGLPVIESSFLDNQQAVQFFIQHVLSYAKSEKHTN